jgi:UDP:flavonoid glycosyltransferase YjiC (YdhE family)
MSRILIAWECGRNWGHLSRLLPLATRLKARGHSVLAVVRDVAAAAATLGAADVSFIQSPSLAGAELRRTHATGYADVLLSQGWADRSALWGALQAWLNVYAMFRPDAALLDFSPTARIASAILGVPCALIGSGFELPPPLDPLPPFPGIAGATAEAAATAERRVLDVVNAVIPAYRREPMRALRQLVEADLCFLATFGELDHYGARRAAHYIGPLADPRRGLRVDWPSGSQRRIFVYLRPEVPALAAALQGLAATGARVIACIPGIAQDLRQRLTTDGCVIAAEPVQLEPVLQTADACLSYASAGVVTAGLLRGIPQLMMPLHVEAQLTAQRVESLGMGRVLPRHLSAAAVAQSIEAMLAAGEARVRAREFAARYAATSAAGAADTVVDSIEALCRETAARHMQARVPARVAAADVQS